MLKGSIVALVTPFNADGSVNYDKLGELLEMHCKYSDGICILGTTGESSTLTFDEEIEIVKYSVAKVNHRVPLIIGSGSNETEKAVKYSKKYSEMGADYCLVITPYYNKTNESGLIKHFEMIAEASKCPIIMYNVPGRTGMGISVKAVERLSKNPKIAGIKEASGNLSYTMKIAKYVNDDFTMLSGNDDIIVPMMSIGSKGVISVLANIAPSNTSKITKLCMENKYEEATDLQLSLLNLINDLFIEVNPIPVKEAMNILGYGVGGYRMPLDCMSENNKAILEEEINNVKELIK